MEVSRPPSSINTGDGHLVSSHKVAPTPKMDQISDSKVPLPTLPTFHRDEFSDIQAPVCTYWTPLPLAEEVGMDSGGRNLATPPSWGGVTFGEGGTHARECGKQRRRRTLYRRLDGWGGTGGRGGGRERGDEDFLGEREGH
ncbi:uncharacterized protein LOC124164414 [Ischnura elegans]|uniref:uncharacterized protein LOC124164414 n=1 Tax=Ischnura elegans TaxID=197161 RepID=UPI001ED8A950|nr:uncharacterized protein LOC124164414 [Ischnura elegans]